MVVFVFVVYQFYGQVVVDLLVVGIGLVFVIYCVVDLVVVFVYGLFCGVIVGVDVGEGFVFV